MKVVEGMPAGQ